MVVGDFPISTDTIVIGAGPGGYVAAIRAAQLGQKVTIVEKNNVGGVCLNVGCIPSKALISAGHRLHEAQHSEDLGISVEKAVLDFSKTQSWKDGIVKKLTGGVTALLKGNNVEIVKGEAYFMDANSLRVITENSSQTYEFKHAIIATGSSPIEIPSIKFSERILDSTGALNLTEVPKKIVVIGGGYIGVELGGAYANLGSEVTILEGGEDILLGFEKDMRALVKRNFKKKKVSVISKAKAQSVSETENQVTLTYEKDGSTQTIEADYVFVMVGRRPNTNDLGLEQVQIELNPDGTIKTDKQCRTNVENIFAIGDITDGLKLAHKASYEGKIAAEVIAGEPAELDYLTIPAVCFTEPELAAVGYTEKEAIEAGYEVKVSKFPFGANGRALSLNATDGFVKLITRKEDGLMLGAQIAGANASDLIGELGLAIEAGMTAEDIALTIHAHPTLGETMMEAAELAIGMPIHVLK